MKLGFCRYCHRLTRNVSRRTFRCPHCGGYNFDDSESSKAFQRDPRASVFAIATLVLVGTYLVYQIVFPAHPRQRGSNFRSQVLEQRNARREAVNVVPPADGPEFALREETRQGDGATDLTEDARVVIRIREQMRSAAVATEE